MGSSTKDKWAKLAAAAGAIEEEDEADCSFVWGNSSKPLPVDLTTPAPPPVPITQRVEVDYQGMVSSVRKCSDRTLGALIQTAEASYKSSVPNSVFAPAHLVHEAIVAGSSSVGGLRGACGPVLSDGISWLLTRTNAAASTARVSAAATGLPLVGTTSGGLVKVARASGGQASEALQAYALLAVGANEVTVLDADEATAQDVANLLKSMKDNATVIGVTTSQLCAVVGKGTPVLFPSSHMNASYTIGPFHHRMMSEGSAFNISRFCLSACALLRASLEARVVAAGTVEERQFMPRTHALEPPATIGAAPIRIPYKALDLEVLGTASASVSIAGRGVVWMEDGGKMAAFRGRTARIMDDWDGRAPVVAMMETLTRVTARTRNQQDVMLTDAQTAALGSLLSSKFNIATIDRRDRRVMGAGCLIDCLASAYPHRFLAAMVACFGNRRQAVMYSKLIEALSRTVDRQFMDKIAARLETVDQTMRKVYAGALAAVVVLGQDIDPKWSVRDALTRLGEAHQKDVLTVAKMKYRDLMSDANSMAAAARWHISLYGKSRFAKARTFFDLSLAISQFTGFDFKDISNIVVVPDPDSDDEDVAAPPYELTQADNDVASIATGDTEFSDADDASDDDHDLDDTLGGILEGVQRAIATMTQERRALTRDAGERYLRFRDNHNILMPERAYMAIARPHVEGTTVEYVNSLVDIRNHIFLRRTKLESSTDAIRAKDARDRTSSENLELVRDSVIVKFLRAWFKSPNGEPVDIGFHMLSVFRNMFRKSTPIAELACAVATFDAYHTVRMSNMATGSDYIAALRRLAKELDTEMAGRMTGVGYTFRQMSVDLLDAIAYPHMDTRTSDRVDTVAAPARYERTLTGAVMDTAYGRLPEPALEAVANFTELDFTQVGATIDFDDMDAPIQSSTVSPSKAMLGIEDALFDQFYTMNADDLQGLSEMELRLRYNMWAAAEAPEDNESDEEAPVDV